MVGHPGNRIRHVEVGVVHDAGRDRRDDDIQQGTDHQRAQDPYRHVALRILGLLRRSRDRVEADIGKENHSRAPRYPRPAELAERSKIRRNEGVPVRCGDPWMPQKKRCHHRDERDYSSDFHKNDSRIEVRRFAYSDHQNRGDDGDDQACREVQYAPRVRQAARIDTRFFAILCNT